MIPEEPDHDTSSNPHQSVLNELDDQGDHDDYDEGEERPSRRIPPRILFASYAMVGGAYIAVMCVIIGVALLGAKLLFPETFAMWGEPPEVVEKMVAENPQKILPTALFWIVCPAGGIAAYVAGWVVSRFAAFAKMGHAIILAVILFVTYLQLAITSEQDLKWMPILFAGVTSICTALGAKRQMRNSAA